MSIVFSLNFLTLSYNTNIVYLEGFSNSRQQFAFNIGAVQFRRSNQQDTSICIVNIVQLADQAMELFFTNNSLQLLQTFKNLGFFFFHTYFQRGKGYGNHTGVMGSDKLLFALARNN